jgi:hypothetical protein
MRRLQRLGWDRHISLFQFLTTFNKRNFQITCYLLRRFYTFIFLSAMVKFTRNRRGIEFYEEICNFISHVKLTFKIKNVKSL